MRGISTVLVTVSPEASRQMRPPRALCPVGFKIGNAFGHPAMRELQKRVLRDAPAAATLPAWAARRAAPISPSTADASPPGSRPG